MPTLYQRFFLKNQKRETFCKHTNEEIYTLSCSRYGKDGVWAIVSNIGHMFDPSDKWIISEFSCKDRNCLPKKKETVAKAPFERNSCRSVMELAISGASTTDPEYGNFKTVYDSICDSLTVPWCPI